MRSVFASRGSELLIVADSIERAALLLNDHCGTPTDERPQYSFTPADLEPCAVYTLAPGYFAREKTLIANAASSGRLFITRGF